MKNDSPSCPAGGAAVPPPDLAPPRTSHRAFAGPGVRWLPLLVPIAVGALAGGCDDSFEPLAPTDAQFSIFGYLDASADTQWVRVMPIRPLVATSPEPSEASVTLERVGSGQIIALRDSVFRYADPVHPELGSEGAYLQNFWTTETIEPGASYQFSAQGLSDEPAEAVVRIPADYEVDVGLAQSSRQSDYLRLVGLKQVPFLAMNAYFRDGCGTGVDRTSYDGGPAQSGVRTIEIPRTSITPREGCGMPVVQSREFWVVGSEAEWPSSGEYVPGGLGEAERASNISNALGFIGGVLTKTIPYETCDFEGGGAPAPDYCELAYGPESVTFAGVVDETRCNDGPIDSVSIELREIDGQPPRIRVDTTDADGAFTIGALDAGIRYALKARAKPVPIYGIGEIDIYEIRYDTLTFATGGPVEYDISMPRLTPCDQQPGAGR